MEQSICDRNHYNEPSTFEQERRRSGTNMREPANNICAVQEQDKTTMLLPKRQIDNKTMMKKFCVNR